jgi:hypothetical protein
MTPNYTAYHRAKISVLISADNEGHDMRTAAARFTQKKPPVGGYFALALKHSLLARDDYNHLCNHIGVQRHREGILAHRLQWAMRQTDLRLI